MQEVKRLISGVSYFNAPQKQNVPGLAVILDLLSISMPLINHKISKLWLER